MKLIKPKVEYLPQASGLEGAYRQIELAGRTCYKSSPSSTSSPSSFVDRMIKSNHTAMLEHGTIYLKKSSESLDANYWELVHSPYTKSIYPEDWNYVTTNLRAVMELFPTTWHGFLDTYLCDPTEFHEKRYTFKLTTSIGVSRELIRHRTLSFAEQSTRYCNYSRDKFGNEITFCAPIWCPDYDETDWDRFLKGLYDAEESYMALISKGWQPQQAREILPLCTATEIVVTGFASDWRHFFDLRLFEKTGKVHPNMRQLAELMKAEAEKQGIWEDIISKPSKFE